MPQDLLQACSVCGVSILQRAVQAQASSSDAIVQESTATPTTASGGLDVPVIGSSDRPGGGETTVPNVSGDLAALLLRASCMLGEHTEARLVSDMLLGRAAAFTLCGALQIDVPFQASPSTAAELLAGNGSQQAAQITNQARLLLKRPLNIGCCSADYVLAGIGNGPRSQLASATSGVQAAGSHNAQQFQQVGQALAAMGPMVQVCSVAAYP